MGKERVRHRFRVNPFARSVCRDVLDKSSPLLKAKLAVASLEKRIIAYGSNCSKENVSFSTEGCARTLSVNDCKRPDSLLMNDLSSSASPGKRAAAAVLLSEWASNPETRPRVLHSDVIRAALPLLLDASPPPMAMCVRQSVARWLCSVIVNSDSSICDLFVLHGVLPPLLTLLDYLARGCVEDSRMDMGHSIVDRHLSEGTLKSDMIQQTAGSEASLTSSLYSLLIDVVTALTILCEQSDLAVEALEDNFFQFGAVLLRLVVNGTLTSACQSSATESPDDPLCKCFEEVGSSYRAVAHRSQLQRGAAIRVAAVALQCLLAITEDNAKLTNCLRSMPEFLHTIQQAASVSSFVPNPQLTLTACWALTVISAEKLLLRAVAVTAIFELAAPDVLAACLPLLIDCVRTILKEDFRDLLVRVINNLPSLRRSQLTAFVDCGDEAEKKVSEAHYGINHLDGHTNSRQNKKCKPSQIIAPLPAAKENSFDALDDTATYFAILHDVVEAKRIILGLLGNLSCCITTALADLTTDHCDDDDNDEEWVDVSAAENDDDAMSLADGDVSDTSPLDRALSTQLQKELILANLWPLVLEHTAELDSTMRSELEACGGVGSDVVDDIEDARCRALLCIANMTQAIPVTGLAVSSVLNVVPNESGSSSLLPYIFHLLLGQLSALLNRRLSIDSDSCDTHSGRSDAGNRVGVFSALVEATSFASRAVADEVGRAGSCEQTWELNTMFNTMMKGALNIYGLQDQPSLFTDAPGFTSTSHRTTATVLCISEASRVNVARIVATLATLFWNRYLSAYSRAAQKSEAGSESLLGYVAHCNEENARSLLAKAAVFLLTVAEIDDKLAVCAEAVDALIDVFADDSTDTVALSLNLNKQLREAHSRICRLLRVSFRDPSSAQKRAVAATCASNLRRFIKYKEERLRALVAT